MGSTDRRYALRHPARWALFFWPHLTVAVSLVLLGWALSGQIFDRVVGYGTWPPLMFATAAVMAGSAFWPLSPRVQRLAGATLGAAAVFRSAAYLQLLVAGAVPPEYFALVWALVSHWGLAIVLAIRWPHISEVSYLKATKTAGRDRGAHAGVA